MNNYTYETTESTNQTPDQPMGWHKFLCIFLFVGAAVNVLTAIMAFTGGHYDGQGDLVYAFFPDLKTVDMLMGIACLALAAYGVYTRMQLAAFKANGPKLLLGLYAAVALVNVFYLIAVSSAIDSRIELDTSSTITQLAVSVAMIFINKVYYDKRQHLFTK